MKKYIEKNIVSIVIMAISVTIIVLTILFMKNIHRELKVTTVNHETSVNTKEPLMPLKLSENALANNFISENDEIIVFLAKVFQIKEEKLKENIIKDYPILKLDDSSNTELSLINYLFSLENKQKSLFSKKTTKCRDSEEYMLALIKYFSDIYENVDYTIAAGIAKIESNYSAKGMLNKNNIFGGLSNGKLIKYRNIEYGILKYIDLLSKGYFKKGLTDIEAIGKVYNPIIKNGKKIANPNWVKNVTNATQEYIEHGEVDINLLRELKEEA